MSGPKISVYSLTGRAQTIVVGQMRCEQQSLACFVRIQEIIRSFQKFSGNFEQQISNIQLLMKRTAEGAEQIEKLRSLQEEIKAEAADIKKELVAHAPRVSAKYRITEEACCPCGFEYFERDIRSSSHARARFYMCSGWRWWKPWR